MARSISTVIRKTDLIALIVDKRPGKTGFRFSFALNFDSAFTALQVVPNHGYKSLTVPDGKLPFSSSMKNQVAFIFRPSDYTTTIPTMVDGIPLYMRVEARNLDGSFGTPEAMHLILANHTSPNLPYTLRGTVPQGANLAASLEIQLPSRSIDFGIKVNTGSPLEMAFERGGPEYSILTEANSGVPYQQVYSSVSQLFLRGSGGTSNISATFTSANNPIA